MIPVTEYGKRACALSARDLDACAFRHPDLLIGRQKSHDQRQTIEIYWAPFDHINKSARVALIGITPGQVQMINALEHYRAQCSMGERHAVASKAAKRTGSFSGAMRDTLVRCLEEVRLHDALGLRGAEQLWDDRSELVHFTSALRWPVFIDGANYQGTAPTLLKQPMLRQVLENTLVEEIRALPDDCMVIPLGVAATSAVYHAVRLIPSFRRTRLLVGMPHPSGASRNVSSQFLGDPPSPNRKSPLNPEYRATALRLREQVLKHCPRD